MKTTDELVQNSGVATTPRTGKDINCQNCGLSFYSAKWELDNGRKFCGKKCYQADWSNKTPGWNKGLKRTWESPTEFKKGHGKGELNINWKGEAANYNKERKSIDYQGWRKAVFFRDDYTCQWCGEKGGRLQADHIYPFATYPHKRLEVGNGRTLCESCHKKTITFGNKKLDLSSITGRFSLLVNETPVDEVNDWTGKKYKMRNDAGVECEVGEFLFGMVRVLKPDVILETGCHKGWSAAYMGAALEENELGHVTTLEIDASLIQDSKVLWQKLGLSRITVRQESSLNFEPKEQYDLLFLDSEPQIRFQELVKFFPHLKPGGYVFIHDLHRHMGQGQAINPDHPEISNWPWGDLPQQIKDWVKDGELRPMHFPTPRGFMGFYKPKEEDYKWL